MDKECLYKEKTKLTSDAEKEADHACAKLRMKFINYWVLNKNLDTYKTDDERNWAFVVKREYRYAVTYWSIFDGMLAGIVCQLAFSFKRKRFAFLPLFSVWYAVYYWQAKKRFNRRDKFYFDMLNLGTELELGAERNRVLEECNRIGYRADL